MPRIVYRNAHQLFNKCVNLEERFEFINSLEEHMFHLVRKTYFHWSHRKRIACNFFVTVC